MSRFPRTLSGATFNFKQGSFDIVAVFDPTRNGSFNVNVFSGTTSLGRDHRGHTRAATCTVESALEAINEVLSNPPRSSDVEHRSRPTRLTLSENKDGGGQ